VTKPLEHTSEEQVKVVCLDSRESQHEHSTSERLQTSDQKELEIFSSGRYFEWQVIGAH
jgi:hypothetical protein